MGEPKTLSHRSVSNVASRLRMLQADLANRPEAERQDHLTEEVRRATSQMLPNQADEFYDRLLEEFPAWGEVVVTGDPNQTDGGPTSEQWNDPAALVSQLVALAGKEPARRRDVVDKLIKSGLVAGALPGTIISGLIRALQLPPQAVVDPVRTVELLLTLMDFMRKQETFVNGAWGAVARGVGGQSSRPLSEVISRYLTTANGPAQKALQQELDAAITLLDRRVRVFAATLRSYSQHHAEKFAPSEIESMVKTGLLSNKTRVCWEKYAELCGGVERDHLESEIRLMQNTIIQRIWSTI